MSKVLNVLLKTIEDVQNKNRKDPNIETADPSVFDLLRKEVGKLDRKIQKKQMQKGKSPKSILDMIKDGVQGVQQRNQNDSNVQTAPGSVFDQILRKVEKPQRKLASSGIKQILSDYQLDVRGIPGDLMNQVQSRYQQDLQKLNKDYAKAIYKLSQQTRR